MSKKQINNRLDKLFDDIKEEEKAIARPPREPKLNGTRKSPALDLVPPFSQRQKKIEVETLDVQVDVTDAYATMSLPLRVDTESWATLQIADSDVDRQWGVEEQILVQQVTEQLALALENARLFQETERRNEELNVLNEIISAASESLDLDTTLGEILERTLSFLKMDAGLMSMVNPDSGELELNVWRDIPAPIIENIHQNGFGGTPCGYVHKIGSHIILPNLHESDAPFDLGELIENHILAYIGIPLVARDRIVGTLCMFHSKPLDISAENFALLVSVGKQVGFAVENARLFQETERRTEELALVNKIVTEVSGSLDMQKNLQLIAEEVAKISSALHVGITLLNEEKTHLVLTADFPETPSDLGVKISLENNPTSVQVLEKHQPLSIQNVQTNPLTAAIKDVMKARGTESLVIFPLLSGKEAIGTLGVDFDDPLATLSQNQTDLIQTILLQASTSIETARFFQKTQASEAEFRALFAAMEDVIFVVDKDTRYLRIAPTNPSGLYRPPEELLGKRMDEILPEETHALFHNAIQQALESNKTVNIEYPLEIDDQETWFYASLSKLGENQVYWIARDITERKQAELQVQRLGNAVEQSLDGMAIADMDGNLEFVNSAWAKMHGYATTAELLGQPLAIFYTEEQLENEVAPFNDTVRTEGSNQGEVGHKRQNGTIFPTWMTVGILRSVDDAPLALVASAQEITERKKAEQTLRRQNEYLTAAAEVGRLVTSTLDMGILFRRIVNLLREHFGYYHAAIFTIEEAGFDAIVREATGEAGEEMKGREHSLTVGSKSVVGTVTETGEPYIVNNVMQDPIHRPNPLLPETKAEAAIPLKIGRRIIGALDLQATEVDAFSPEDIAILQILADQFATAIDNARSYKLAQDAFTEMREIDKLKSQFLANMSHELRTPLNSIIGFSRVILKGIDGPVTELQKQDLGAIYNSGQHLLGLINDILDLSKIEAGKMELAFDEVNIEKLIKSVVSTVVGLIKDKPVRLEEDIAADLPIVKADSMRVRQILINLFSNAAKFTSEGIIKVTAKRDGGYVRISIIDSGPGIAEEDQEKLFQAFSQVDASATRATGGTGLGLSICQELVKMHGGEIDVISDVGKGSTFHFTLPVYHKQEVSQEVEKEELQGDYPIILAIDDDEQVISLYQRYLNTQGYQVIALTEPKKAVKRVKELSPHAITLDIMMPGYDGWQVLHDLKSDPETQQIPIIICSIVENTEKGYALGATDYLLKPIIEDDLLGALRRLNSEGTIHEVLIIDDDPDDLRILEKLLDETKNYKPILAEGGLAGWDRIVNHPPHAVILDLFMPEMDGFEIMDAMQASIELRDIPVIIVSGGDLTSTQQEKLTLLNHHILQKGTLDSDELLAILERNLSQLKHTNQKGKE